MPAFHPESVCYGCERRPPREFADESRAAAPALPLPAARRERWHRLPSAVSPAGVQRAPGEPKPWPATRAQVSGRSSLAFSLCCLALEQLQTVKWRVGGGTPYQLWQGASTCGRTKHGAIRTVLDVHLCFYYLRCPW